MDGPLPQKKEYILEALPIKQENRFPMPRIYYGTQLGLCLLEAVRTSPSEIIRLGRGAKWDQQR